MPEGYVIETETGQWGYYGTTLNSSAMNRETAEEFVRRMAQETELPVEHFKLVQIEAKYVEGINSPSQSIERWNKTGFGGKGVERG